MNLNIITRHYFNKVELYFEVFVMWVFFIIVKIISESYGISALSNIIIFFVVPIISLLFFSYLFKYTNNNELIKIKHISKSDIAQYTIFNIIISASFTINMWISIIKLFQMHISNESTLKLSTISNIPDYSIFIIPTLLTSISIYCIYYKYHKHHLDYSRSAIYQ